MSYGQPGTNVTFLIFLTGISEKACPSRLSSGKSPAFRMLQGVKLREVGQLGDSSTRGASSYGAVDCHLACFPGFLLTWAVHHGGEMTAACPAQGF